MATAIQAVWTATEEQAKLNMLQFLRDEMENTGSNEIRRALRCPELDAECQTGSCGFVVLDSHRYDIVHMPGVPMGMVRMSVCDAVQDWHPEVQVNGGGVRWYAPE